MRFVIFSEDFDLKRETNYHKIIIMFVLYFNFLMYNN